jgi:hypothetical protein
MSSNPKKLVLYLEDLEYLVDVLGPSTVISIGNVQYKEFKEFKRKYYNKEINEITLKNSNGDIVEFYSFGSTHIYIEDKNIALQVSNYLYERQPQVYEYIGRLISFVSKVWATFIIVLLLSLIFIVKDKEFTAKLFEQGLGLSGLIFLPSLLHFVLPSRYSKHRIICRTSDDKKTLFNMPLFKEWIVPITTGLISSLLTAIILHYLWR